MRFVTCHARDRVRGAWVLSCLLPRRAVGRRVLWATAVAACVCVSAPAAALADFHVDIKADGLKLIGNENFCKEDQSSADEFALTWHSGDMAFWGDRAVVACGAEDQSLENDGFVILDIAGTEPVKLGAFQCVASASDIQIWGDLVFLAVDRNGESKPPLSPGPRGKDCEADVIARNHPDANEIFQGVRIVSIKHPSAPKLVKSIRLNTRGAHTLSVVGDSEHGRVLVHATSPGADPPPNASVERVKVISVPLDQPADATVLDPETGAPVEIQQDSTGKELPPPGYAGTDFGCHDVAFFESRGLAVCTGVEGGSVIYDTRDDSELGYDTEASPVNPKEIGRIAAPQGAPDRRDHGAAFSWDGEVLVMGDEAHLALASATCDAKSRLWFYDVRDPRDPKMLGSLTHSPHAGNFACHAKQLAVLPLVDGRDVAVVSWLGGGTTLVDFTRINHPDPAKRQPPHEIGHWMANESISTSSGLSEDNGSTVWSAYWYNGIVYANNAYGCLNFGLACFGTKTRGLDRFKFAPDLELDGTAPLPRLNYPTQECLSPAGWSRGELAACGSE